MPVTVVRSARDEDAPIRQQSCRVLIAGSTHAARIAEGRGLGIVDLGARMYLRAASASDQHPPVGEQCRRMRDAGNVHHTGSMELQRRGVKNFRAGDVAARAVGAAATPGYEDISV